MSHLAPLWSHIPDPLLRGAPRQVIDDDGTDRTPKPLMSLNPSVLRGAGNHDNSDAASEAASEFFLVGRAGGCWRAPVLLGG